MRFAHCPTIHSTGSATEVIGGSSTDTQRETNARTSDANDEAAPYRPCGPHRLRAGRCVAAGPGGAGGVQGRWDTVPALVTINPVHMALMNNGKVLIVAGSGNVAAERNFRAMVWDPQTGTFSSAIPLAWDMFCNGMVALPDGQIFINGGNLAYDPFWGERRTALFDPAAGVFTNIENMAHGRWYPTVTALGDGSIMTFSGLLDTGGTNSSVEIYTPGSGWSPEYTAGWTPPLYPRMHLLTDGKVAYVGSGTPTRTFDPVAHTWSAVITNTLTYTGSVRHVGVAAVVSRRLLQIPRHDFWRRQPLSRLDGDHRFLGGGFHFGRQARRCRSRASK